MSQEEDKLTRPTKTNISQQEDESLSPTGYIRCPVCGEIIKSRGKYGHFSRNHPDLNYDEWKDKFTIARPPGEGEGEGEEGGVPYKGEPDANAILRKILERHPGIPKNVVKEVMDWATLRGSIDPQFLNYLLQNMKGVSNTTANIVAQKYSIALQKASEEGRIQLPFPITPFVPTSRPTYQPYYGMSYPSQPYQPTYPYQPYYQPQHLPPQAGMLSREEVEELIERREREKEKKSKLDRIEQMVLDLKSRIESGEIGGKKEEGPMVRVTEPLRDRDGAILLDEKGRPIVRTIEGPANVVIRRDVDELDRLERYARILGPRQQLTLEDVRKVVREETKPKESSELKKLEERLKSTEEKYEKLKDQLSAKEKKWLEDKIADLKARMEDIRKESGAQGYKEDTFRLLDRTLRELTDILKSKKPVEVIRDILAPKPSPPEAKGAKEAKTALEEELKEFVEEK